MGVRNVSGIPCPPQLHGQPRFDGAALALDPRQGDRGARRWPPDRIERSYALGIVRVLRTPDGAAGILGSRRGATAARSHYDDFRPMGRAAHRAVYVPPKRQARGFVPEVRLLAALSYRDHDAHTGGQPSVTG